MVILAVHRHSQLGVSFPELGPLMTLSVVVDGVIDLRFYHGLVEEGAIITTS